MSMPLARSSLTVFRRRECILCDDAEAMLAAELAARAGRGEATPSVRRVDITRDAELEARYGARVPVLSMGEEELGPALSPRQIRAFLARALRWT